MEQENLEATQEDIEKTNPAEEVQQAEAEEAAAVEAEVITEAPPVAETVEDGGLAAEVEKLKDENAVLRNQVLRARADFENAKRRTEREKQDAIKFANKKIFFQLLGVMDNFERAMGASMDPDDPFVVGITMIQKQLEEVLTQNGVQEVAALNHPFDPYNHEAFAKEENDDFPENTVIEVFQKGYKFFDHLLRPATVKVSTRSDEEV